jgi:hypothetical protein
MAWLGLAWLGLAWLGLVWFGLVCSMMPLSPIIGFVFLREALSHVGLFCVKRFHPATSFSLNLCPFKIVAHALRTRETRLALRHYLLAPKK